MGFHAVVELCQIFQAVVGRMHGIAAQYPQKSGFFGVLFDDMRNDGSRHQLWPIKFLLYT